MQKLASPRGFEPHDLEREIEPVHAGSSEKAASESSHGCESTWRVKGGPSPLGTVTEQDTYRMVAEELFSRVTWLVEATHEETFQLWCHWHEKLDLWRAGIGHTFVVDYVDIRAHGERKFQKMPVAVRVLWHPVEGHLVGFYEATSLVVDHDMVQRWLEKVAPHAAHTNASNFAHVFRGLGLKPRGAA